jgi:hypothetical protein
MRLSHIPASPLNNSRLRSRTWLDSGLSDMILKLDVLNKAKADAIVVVLSIHPVCEHFKVAFDTP